MPAMRRAARRFLVYNCFDCNWVGNRPDEYAAEELNEVACPECGESAGAEFWVQEDARWADPK